MDNERTNFENDSDPKDNLDPDAPEQLASDDGEDEGDGALDDIILPDSPDAPTPF